MRKIPISLLIIFPLVSAYAAWEPLGPYGGSLNCFASSAGETIFYAAASNYPTKILKSTNAGASWFTINSINDYIYSLAVDPTNADIVYAGAQSYVYKSTNGGADWQGYYLPAYYAYSLAINPINPAIIYASGNYNNGSTSVFACHKSTDAGVTWTTIPLSTAYGLGYCVTIDPTASNNVYISGYYYDTQYHPCVYKSTNGGSSFTEISTGLPTGAYYIQTVKVHPTNGLILYAGSYYGGIFRSTNGGASWISVDTSGKFITSLSAAPIAPNIGYAGGDTVVYKTTDAGATWTKLSLGFAGQAKSNRTVFMSAITANLVMTTDTRGFFKSTDAGVNWIESNQGITLAAASALSTAPSAPARIYTEYEGMGVYRTTNNGTSWIKLPTPLECGAICEFAVHRTNPDHILGLEGLG